MLTSDQIRAARGLKNWSQKALAKYTGLALPTIAKIENGTQKPGTKTLEKILFAFESSGLEFTNSEGVRKRSGYISNYSGRDGFFQHSDIVDRVAQNNPGSEFLQSNIVEENFMKWSGEERQEEHRQCMLDNNISYKILVQEGDTYMPAGAYAEYRWTPKEQFYSVPLYIYKDRVAIMDFKEDDVDILVIQHENVADMFRRQFYEMWDRALPIPDDLIHKT